MALPESDARRALWRQIAEGTFDILIIGGGITGAGVLREAVRHELRAVLVEQRDFAWGTSSRSSKMVHGGLRYLAAGDFRLTAHSLQERERLLHEAPGLVRRTGYLFAHRRGEFPPRFAVTLLLWLYDFLAGIRDHRFFPRDKFLRLLPGCNRAKLIGGTRYTDALTDDARLVLRVLQEAGPEGGVAINYVKAVRLIEEKGQVAGAVLRNELSEEEIALRAKVVVNATGAWADELRQGLIRERKVRPQRGSHIVLPASRLPMGQALTFLHPEDRRPLFAFPWEGATVVGTTDLDHPDGLDREASMTRAELAYLLRGINQQFPQALLTEKDIIASFAGVRPIVSSGKGLKPSQERRDHVVWNDRQLITVTGGKLTTFRLIALDVLRAAQDILGLARLERAAPIFTRHFGGRHPRDQFPDEVSQRLKGRYGDKFSELLDLASTEELDGVPGTLFLWAELRFAARCEQVVHLDDLLLRRTRLGLLLREGGRELMPRIKAIVQPELGWDDARWREEEDRYYALWRDHYSLPA